MDHSFNPIFAQRYGMVAAVIIHDFAYWIHHNRANGRNFYESRYWTYNSAKAFQDMYPYMGKSQIYAAMRKMQDDGLIVKGDFNSDKWNHTPWYSITDKGYAVIAECETKSAELRNSDEFENQTVENQEIEHSLCENCDDDVRKVERRRSENATTYTDTNTIILGTPDTYTNTETHLENICISCAERENPDSPPQGPAVFTLPLNDGTEHRVTQADFDKYESLYPAVDVMQELRKMAGWLDSNPKNRKTKNGIRRFINSWLARAQDSAKANNGNRPNVGIDRRNNLVPKQIGKGIVV